ncbi:MAG: hypothetical protein GY797_25835 [Deltaproteobacteria bacterium]|nr:hypothetical protein [Deltaproteobacteria bacterium]
MVGDKIPKDKTPCPRCGASGTETEYYEEPMGGASRDTVRRSRQVDCKACYGKKYI